MFFLESFRSVLGDGVVEDFVGVYRGEGVGWGSLFYIYYRVFVFLVGFWGL